MRQVQQALGGGAPHMFHDPFRAHSRSYSTALPCEAARNVCAACAARYRRRPRGRRYWRFDVEVRDLVDRRLRGGAGRCEARRVVYRRTLHDEEASAAGGEPHSYARVHRPAGRPHRRVGGGGLGSRSGHRREVRGEAAMPCGSRHRDGPRHAGSGRRHRTVADQSPRVAGAADRPCQQALLRREAARYRTGRRQEHDAGAGKPRA